MASAATPAGESTKQQNRQPAATSAATQRSARGSSSWLASSTRGTSQPRSTRAWCAVAAVMPQAPAASWAVTSERAIAVLACGACRTPRAAQKRAKAAMLAVTVLRRRVSSGQLNGPSNRP